MSKMKVEKYIDQSKRLPKTGRQIIGSIEQDNIIVYQAFNAAIADYAVEHQKFGGNSYSFNRMSWIKPGFLWMMYRSGWATKEYQEKILAITLLVNHVKTILSQATISSYDEQMYASKEEWKSELDRTSVRLQWDPDHNPFGVKQERKAIQIGMKGDILKQFCTDWIIAIDDITSFVKTAYEKVQSNNIEDLMIPYEEILVLEDEDLEKRIGIINE